MNRIEKRKISLEISKIFTNNYMNFIAENAKNYDDIIYILTEILKIITYEIQNAKFYCENML